MGVTVEQLTAEIAELDRKRSELLEQRKALQIASLPWKVGDVLEMTSTSYAVKGSQHKVVRVYSAEHGWPRVVSRLADGSWGRRERTLYRDFKVIGHEDG